MKQLAGLLLRRELIFLSLAILLGTGAAAAYWASRATVLTVAVAPRDGTEPALIQAYADALAKRHKEIRLQILPFDDDRDSAEALREGRADLAVVRPDVDLPDNGLTLAILRDQAMIIAAPEVSGIDRFPDLDRKRLAILAHRDADEALIRALLGHYGLSLVTTDPDAPLPPRHVGLVEMAEADLAAAFARKRVDAVISVIAPTAPAAQRIIEIVQGASRNRKVSFVDMENADAFVARMPRLQVVTMPAETFGGSPKVPGADIRTVGASYRLMARANLTRSVAADVTQHLFELRSGMANVTASADYVQAPAYDSTVGATSARLPIHPGAVDYYEREQQSFIERYETWIYLLAFLGGGIGSAVAWIGQRLSRLRRERVEEATDRLLAIRHEAQATEDRDRLHALAREIDDLAGDIARHALERPTEARTMSAASIAIDAARSTVKRVITARALATEADTGSEPPTAAAAAAKISAASE